MIKISKNDEITRLFYELHERPSDIAKQVGVVKSYVTKIIQKDKRYIEEKERRKAENKEKHKECKRKYIQKRRQEEKMQYLAMMVQIDKDNKYLSTKKELSDEAFAKWNRSAYEYCKNSSDLKLRNGINAGYTAPKRVRNIVNANSIRATGCN